MDAIKIVVTCPVCEAVNELHVVGHGVASSQSVNCSHCGLSMGTWDAVKQQSRKPLPPTHNASP